MSRASIRKIIFIIRSNLASDYRRCTDFDHKNQYNSTKGVNRDNNVFPKVPLPTRSCQRTLIINYQGIAIDPTCIILERLEHTQPTEWIGNEIWLERTEPNLIHFKWGCWVNRHPLIFICDIAFLRWLFRKIISNIDLNMEIKLALTIFFLSFVSSIHWHSPKC